MINIKSAYEHSKELIQGVTPSMSYDGGHRFYADDAWPIVHKYLKSAH